MTLLFYDAIIKYPLFCASTKKASSTVAVFLIKSISEIDFW